jgi:hypothetical protein
LRQNCIGTFFKADFASLTRFQFGPRLAARFFSLLMPDPPSHKQAARAHPEKSI